MKSSHLLATIAIVVVSLMTKAPVQQLKLVLMRLRQNIKQANRASL